MRSSNDTNNTTHSLPTGSSPEAPEIFTVRRGIDGWHLIPANPQSHPLLAKLFGAQAPDGSEPQQADPQDLRRGMEWGSLEEGLRLIRSVGKASHQGVRVCGNLAAAPTVHLWRKSLPERPPMAKVFADLRGDAAKWGISDFYDEHKEALRQVLSGKEPFDTGWFGVKKEIQTGRIYRTIRGGYVHIEVSASMDDWPDLVDTAVWEAGGKTLGASSGFDVLLKLGLTEAQAEQWLDEVATQEAEYGELEEDNSCSDRQQLSGRIGFDRLCEALDSLMDGCERTLEATYKGVVESCRQRLAELKLGVGASCANCLHFHGAIGASRVSPEDPADCGHPRYYALLSANKAFPFEHGCKFWVARHPMKPTK